MRYFGIKNVVVETAGSAGSGGDGGEPAENQAVLKVSTMRTKFAI